jgi:hypothetical protein
MSLSLQEQTLEQEYLSTLWKSLRLEYKDPKLPDPPNDLYYELKAEHFSPKDITAPSPPKQDAISQWLWNFGFKVIHITDKTYTIGITPAYRLMKESDRLYGILLRVMASTDFSLHGTYNPTTGIALIQLDVKNGI